MTEQPAKTMTIYRKYFDLIAEGRKTVEVRVAYPKNTTLAAGQMLRFVSGEAVLDTRITAVHAYDSFEAMADAEDIETISGEPQTREEIITACRQIYPTAKEALGVLAIHLALIEPEAR